MNKDDIKKALGYCSNTQCPRSEKCPYNAEFDCADILCKDALNLITEQEKEIERLKAENACLLKACEEQFTFDTKEIKNCDYVVNAGVSWDNLAPLYTSSTKEAAIDTARHLTIECVEVVYSPCDNLNVDEVVWSNRR